MADVKKLFGTDKKKELEGVWHDLGEGLEVLVARIGNPKYKKRFQAITKPHRRALDRKTLPDEVAERLMIQCMSETILLDWKGLEEDGKEVPYSTENAIRILTEYRDLREYIDDISKELEGYKQEEDEEAIDNLKK